MDDREIIKLYLAREETAIQETDRKYGSFLTAIAGNILNNLEDSEECVNDTYFKAWRSIPPTVPKVLSAFLSKITRSGAIDIYRKKNSEKRTADNYAVSLQELEDCIAGHSTEEAADLKLLGECIGRYLRDIKPEYAQIFICRYYYFDSVSDIAAYFGYGKEKVKSILHRLRQGLKGHLIKEGYDL